jgi:hypothetical protein
MALAYVIWVAVLASAIWVGFDSTHLGVKSHCLGGGFADMGPVGWFFCVLLLWIIGFPVYRATRPKYVIRHQSGQARPLDPAAMAGNAQTLPPPGWYADPNARGGQRWWDGNQWGPPSAPPAIPIASKG